jgi:hypothetical protein
VDIFKVQAEGLPESGRGNSPNGIRPYPVNRVNPVLFLRPLNPDLFPIGLIQSPDFDFAELDGVALGLE